MPGNLDRLREYFDRHRPRLLFTLGLEAAAFVRGISHTAAARDVDSLLYGAPARLTFVGHDLDVVHLVHPHLFIKKNEKWMSTHNRWCEATGRPLVLGLQPA